MFFLKNQERVFQILINIGEGTDKEIERKETTKKKGFCRAKKKIVKESAWKGITHCLGFGPTTNCRLSFPSSSVLLPLIETQSCTANAYFHSHTQLITSLFSSPYLFFFLSLPLSLSPFYFCLVLFVYDATLKLMLKGASTPVLFYLVRNLYRITCAN